MRGRYRYDDYKDDPWRPSPKEEAEQILLYAARDGRLSEVQRALDWGADIHVNTDEALLNAAGIGHYELVKFLIDRGADVHADNDQSIRMAAGIGSSSYEGQEEVDVNRYIRTILVLLENGSEWKDVEAFSVRSGYWPDKPVRTWIDNRVTTFLREVLKVDSLPDSREELINMLKIDIIHKE